MNINPDIDPTEITIQKQTNIALAKLNAFKTAKVHLKRPVFFVSGWCDEPCSWWIGPKGSAPGISQWINQIVDNPDQVTFIDFSDITAQCQSFIDFAQSLKTKIWTTIGRDQPFDLIGYSMGGLVIRAALTQDEPFINCQNCITADAPHRGDDFGGVVKALEKYAPHLMAKADDIPLYKQQQVENMDPNSQPVQLINSLQNRNLFLSRVNKFLQFKGSRDWVVMNSGFMDTNGIDEIHIQRIGSIEPEGCEHVGPMGVTIDVRTILAILYMLLDIPIPSASNHGIFPNGNYTPVDENEIFI